MASRSNSTPMVVCSKASIAAGPASLPTFRFLLTATLRLVHFWRKGTLETSRTPKPNVTLPQLMLLYYANPEIAISVNRVAGMTLTRRKLTASYAALIHYAGSTQHKTVAVESFLNRVGDGLNLNNENPAWHLQKFLISQRNNGEKRKGGRLHVLALAIKAWNYYKEDRKMMALRLKPDEPFPVL